MSQNLVEDKTSPGAKACCEGEFFFLLSVPAFDRLGRQRASEISVFDFLTNNSTAGARVVLSEPGASTLNQGQRASTGAAANSGKSGQEQPALPEMSLLFAELLTAGTLETAGAQWIGDYDAKGPAKEPSRKSQSKVANLESPASSAAALLVLANFISPIQFDSYQVCGAGAVDGDVPIRNTEMEAQISNRDLGLGSDGALVLNAQLGETNGAVINPADGGNPGPQVLDDGEGQDEQALRALSPVPLAPSALSADSQVGDRQLSATPAPHRDLELPVSKPADPRSGAALPGCDVEPGQKSVASAAPLENAAAGGGISGQARRNLESDGGTGRRPTNAEAAGAAPTEHAPGKASPIAMPSDTGGTAEAVFGLLLAGADGNSRPDYPDVEARTPESSTTAASFEPNGAGEPSDDNVPELLHSHRNGPHPPFGDQYPPEAFRQSGESASPSPSSRAPEFSLFARGAETPEPIGQVWSRLDAGGVPSESDTAAPAQTLASLDLTSIGPERISVRVLESRGGLEVQVATPDSAAKQRLLGGLEELASRVRDLSLGTLVQSLERPDTGQDFHGGERHHPAFDREDRRTRVKKAGAAFALPVDLLGETVSSALMRPV